jgi:hypothetical protein
MGNTTIYQKQRKNREANSLCNHDISCAVEMLGDSWAQFHDEKQERSCNRQRQRGV